MVPVKGKKKVKKSVSQGIVHIYTSFNNIIVTVTDTLGNALSSSTAGAKGFKGSKKSTPFAAQLATEDACRKAKEYGLKAVDVLIKGPGAGRESALRAVATVIGKVLSIKDITPVPFNGCRPPKKRRM